MVDKLTIIKLQEHAALKPLIISALSNETKKNNQRQYTDYWRQDGSIVKEDNNSKQYAQIFLPVLKQYTSRFFEQDQKLKYQIWFQQYYYMQDHEWHNHMGSNLVVIYYVELDESGPKTIFKNEDSTILTPDVKEGDLIFFDGELMHKSPANKTKQRKTIISCNISINTNN